MREGLLDSSHTAVFNGTGTDRRDKDPLRQMHNRVNNSSSHLTTHGQGMSPMHPSGANTDNESTSSAKNNSPSDSVFSSNSSNNNSRNGSGNDDSANLIGTNASGASASVVTGVVNFTVREREEEQGLHLTIYCKYHLHSLFFLIHRFDLKSMELCSFH